MKIEITEETLMKLISWKWLDAHKSINAHGWNYRWSDIRTDLETIHMLMLFSKWDSISTSELYAVILLSEICEHHMENNPFQVSAGPVPIFLQRQAD